MSHLICNDCLTSEFRLPEHQAVRSLCYSVGRILNHAVRLAGCTHRKLQIMLLSSLSRPWRWEVVTGGRLYSTQQNLLLE